MTSADIPAGMRLKQAAGWNQTAADWQRFLNASPEGCFVATVDGRVCGTAATITYPGIRDDTLAWIGMVLVDPEYRGRGIGTQLLEHAIEYLDSRNVTTIKLDATPAGQPIYRAAGFNEEFAIERWQLRKRQSHKSPQTSEHRRDLHPLLEWDREIFAADRSALLTSIHAAAPEFTFTVTNAGELAGYCLGRHGTRADHLGPWIAEDEDTAQVLLEGFLDQSAASIVFVDVLANNFGKDLVQSHGFEFSRPLLRMFRGQNHFSGHPEFACAVIGPEFG
jgi:GNAT superfamily N-acetyltransferase